ncbi:MAG: hypothetical protein AB7K68_16355 [Bacteriovoracia bacterium]
MFDYLPEVGRQLRGELIGVYWTLLVPFVVLLIILEFFKEEPPNVREIFRRVVISIIMLYSFDYVISAIALVGDGITERIDGIQKLWDVMKNLGPNYNNSTGDWFSLRETAIYFFGIAAYIISYLGFFVATALIHFVWTVLYICSPLMILMYVSKGTAYVTKSLYTGLIQVVTWKVLYSILGVLLLKLAMNPQVTGMEDYLMSIIINLCIGVSMLFIPFATKSFLNDGLQGAASALAAVPTMAAGVAIKGAALAASKKLAAKGMAAGNFLSLPAQNWTGAKIDKMRARFSPAIAKAQNMKQQWKDLGLATRTNAFGHSEKIRRNRDRSKK